MKSRRDDEVYGQAVTYMQQRLVYSYNPWSGSYSVHVLCLLGATNQGSNLSLV